MRHSPTEWLLTGPFRIPTATNCQRAACRILDGVPLGKLAEDPEVVEFVGGPEALAALHTSAPQEVTFLSAIRAAKTITACAAAYRATQTVDVSRLGPGEVARVSLVSLKLDTSAVAFGILRDTIKSDRTLAATLMAEPTADSLVVRHPSGRPIEIASVAGAKAGAGLVARWSAGVVFDEAPRMAGKQDGVVNLDDARSAILGRLLPGAQALYIGSPWAPFGTVYDLVQQYWRKPTANMVVLRGTGPMLNPMWWTPERCQRLQDQDPVAFQTDVMGEFADPESGLLNPIAVRRATRETPLELPPDPTSRRSYSAAVDPAEGSASGNAWALVLVEDLGESSDDEQDERAPRFRVVLAREYRGLSPDACWREIAATLKPYDVTHAVSDQYAASANVDLAARYGLTIEIQRTTQQTKVEDFTNLATLIHRGAIELPPDRVFRNDLLSVRKRTTQTGVSIVLPRSSDGRHSDFAPALAAALRNSSCGMAWVDDPLDPTTDDPIPRDVHVPDWYRQASVDYW